MQSSVSRALGAQGTILTANYLLTYLGLRFKVRSLYNSASCSPKTRHFAPNEKIVYLDPIRLEANHLTSLPSPSLLQAPRFQPLLAPLPSPPKALPNPSLPSRPSKAQPLSTQVGVAPSSSATKTAPRSRLTVGGGSLSSTGKRPTVLAAPLRGGGLKGW